LGPGKKTSNKKLAVKKAAESRQRIVIYNACVHPKTNSQFELIKMH